jgi:Arylsulfotransferase (ASST)
VHTLVVSGPGGLTAHPAYDASVRRYAATTTAATFADGGASLTVTATTDDPAGRVLVNGVPVVGGQTTLTGLQPGDEVSVVFDDAGGREADAVYVLPADFPELTATVREPGTTPGLVALTLSQWQVGNGWPSFEAVVDVNGVPVWTRSDPEVSADLKRQPDGHYSVTRPTHEPGRTGSDVVELDGAFQLVAVHRTVGLVDTDGHDSILRADGSAVLLAYEPDPDTGLTDSVIQEVDAQGDVVFQWDSSALAAETVAGARADYAHINSVQVVNGGEDFLASFRHLSAVLLIARVAHDGHQPGDVVWKLGGRDSTFDFVGDPFGGPCAQHSASQLPDGDIMVFDNGSADGFGSFCVDPADPAGPPIERKQSRMAVWHLDEQAGTATLVRSYAPTDWFGFFMGSAQLLPETGNVLVGWASATQAVATELAPDDTPVWQLEAVPSSNGRKYFSYRSLKLDAPDVTDPEVVVTSPARGASYEQGAPVTLDFSCTDVGGSTLQTCGDALPGTPLDTSVPGRHLVRVTAADGAGNVATVLRRYTVAPRHRPDLSVREADGTWTGAGVVGDLRRQTTHRRLAAGDAVRVPVRLDNAGTRADRFVVDGRAGTRRLGVTYRFGHEDVTGPVVRGAWRTPLTQPGGRQVLVVRVRATRDAPAALVRTFVLACTSTRDTDSVDRAGVRVRVR